MQSSPSIRFRNVPNSPVLEAEILAKVEKLERYCDRITSCRVVLSASHRHAHGGICQVRIDLAVPGEEIVIDHESGLDPTHEDVRIAIRDAFRAARRRLQDHVRRRREFAVPLSGSPSGLEAPFAPAPGTSRLREPRRHGTREVEIQAGPVRLPATSTVPEGMQAFVIHARTGGGAGNGKHDHMVSEFLHSEHLGTLSFDLLTPEERRKRQNALDVGLMARRLTQATRWAEAQDEVRGKPIGYFGAGTGAAAALVAAAGDPAIGAVVCRSGRPALATDALPFVLAPTLLLVCGEDGLFLTENRKAFESLGGPKDLVVLPGASYLVMDPDEVRSVARMARAWFLRYLGAKTEAKAGVTEIEEKSSTRRIP